MANEFFLIFGLVSFSFLAAMKKEWGIYLIILLLPTYQIRFSVVSVPMTFLESLILLLTAIEFASLIHTGQFKTFWWEQITTKPKVSLSILLFLLAAIASIYVSPVPIKGAGIFKAYFLEAVLFYFLCLAIIDTKKKFTHVVQSLATLVCYVSLFGIYQFITLYNLPFSWWGIEVAERRITSLLNHPNAVALLLGPVLAMLMVLPKSKISFIAIASGLVALFMTFSRASWLALIATLILFGLISSAYRKKIFVLGVVLGILMFTAPYSRNKVLEVTVGNDPSKKNRYVLWHAAFDMLKKSPVTGVGLMGFHENFKNYPVGPDRVIQNYPHNFFLNFWLETGFIGLLSISALLVLFYKKIWELMKTNNRTVALGTAAGITMVLLHGMVDVPYF